MSEPWLSRTVAWLVIDEMSPRAKAKAKAMISTREAGIGAIQGRQRVRALLDSWFASHARNARGSLTRLLAEPMQTLMTTLVIGIALALPAALWIAVDNLRSLGGSWQNTARISLFIDKRASDETTENLIKTVERMSQFDEVDYISPEAALVEFQQSSGFGEVLALLQENPLPGVLLLSPKPALVVAPESLKSLLGELEQLAGVAQVQLDMQWLQRMQHILKMGQRVAVLLGVALSLGVLLAVGNTIRLAIESRRDEILVVKLVGGTNGFVRRPFLYTGLWYGFAGGILAWLGVAFASMWLGKTVSELASLYQSSFSLHGPGLMGLILLASLGGVLGLLGAAVAVGRHISGIEP